VVERLPLHRLIEQGVSVRALIQRVSQASVTVDGEVVGAIGQGVVVLLGITHGDTDEEARWLARKIAGLRIFEDREGKMNVGLLEVGGEALVVSQFTLYADASKGRRPSFVDAAPPEVAEPLVKVFAQALRGYRVPVQQGVFGAMMMVEIHNDGPVTIMLEK
jgi:D-tyrosyl-tRNA(Tyr) deacylase